MRQPIKKLFYGPIWPCLYVFTNDFNETSGLVSFQMRYYFLEEVLVLYNVKAELLDVVDASQDTAIAKAGANITQKRPTGFHCEFLRAHTMTEMFIVANLFFFSFK